MLNILLSTGAEKEENFWTLFSNKIALIIAVSILWIILSIALSFLTRIEKRDELDVIDTVATYILAILSAIICMILIDYIFDEPFIGLSNLNGIIYWGLQILPFIILAINIMLHLVVGYSQENIKPFLLSLVFIFVYLVGFRIMVGR